MGGGRPVSHRRRFSAGIDTALHLTARLAGDGIARLVQLAIEYDRHPPHGGIDWTQVDRDSFAGRVEGFAHQALDEHPEMLARVLGTADKAG